MTRTFKTLALAGTLALATAATPLSAATLGEAVEQGRLSVEAVEQLIMGTGLTLSEGLSSTLDDVVSIRWQDD